MITKEQGEMIGGEMLICESVISTLDIPVYKMALEQMQKSFSTREAATILSPRPFSELPEQDFQRLQIKQLELYVQLAENFQAMTKAKAKIQRAKENSNSLAHIFS